MKKVFAIVTGMIFAGLVACGPSAEEQKKMADQLQAAADSAANALLQSASNAATDTAAVTAPMDTTKK